MGDVGAGGDMGVGGAVGARWGQRGDPAWEQFPGWREMVLAGGDLGDRATKRTKCPLTNPVKSP